jgi:CRP-like cAMP-binding protein
MAINMQQMKLSAQNLKFRASYSRVASMKPNHPAKTPVSFKDRSNLLLSREAKFPDYRAKTIPYLSKVPEQGIASLIAKAKTLRYARKTTIDLECNKADTLLIIFSGNASVLNLYDNSCKGAIIQVQEPQSGFGKIALITDELRSVSSVTLEQTVFAVIFKSDFIAWLMDYPDVEFTLLSVLKEKLDS